MTNRLATAIALAALTASTFVPIEPAQAEDLIVKFDQSQIIRLPRNAAEIIIGNPSIADVSLQAANLLVITGKSFGITNIIALDAERQVIQDQRILVRRDEHRVVNVYKATARSSYNCAPQCNPQLIPGDDEKYFNGFKSTAELKIGFSEKAADSASAAGSQN